MSMVNVQATKSLIFRGCLYRSATSHHIGATTPTARNIASMIADHQRIAVCNGDTCRRNHVLRLNAPFVGSNQKPARNRHHDTVMIVNERLTATLASAAGMINPAPANSKTPAIVPATNQNLLG